MNKPELIKNIASKTGLSQAKVDDVVKAFQEVVIETLANGDDVKLIGFGTFETIETKEREVQVNPKKPELGKKTIPASRTPKFRVGSELKKAVKESK